MRCIFLKIDHPKIAQLQRLRFSFDPLAEKVPPHITLVFPFPLSWDIARFSRILSKVNIPKFISLGQPALGGDYFFFPLNEGRAEIETLHNQIYSKLPPELLSKDYNYSPHVTFGRLRPGQDTNSILREATELLPFEMARVHSIVMEKIQEDATSHIELEILSTP